MYNFASPPPPQTFLDWENYVRQYYTRSRDVKAICKWGFLYEKATNLRIDQNEDRWRILLSHVWPGDNNTSTICHILTLSCYEQALQTN